ncbi:MULTISPECIES: hypothetical protein [Pseudomonas]|uniref:Filamentous hemagglutinin n=3 Tax=Pseudomonas TaxID=286 RepID=A0ABX6H9V7_9PSED|nr:MULTISPECIES: hypothetical protein [Pseudomonas]MBC3954360.1 hypothetical protein [Pseudomonas triticifolii]QHF02335.1 hypothetical protein N015_07885 [Pseudomonas asturiensis]
MATEQFSLGGWSPYRELTPKDQEIFNEALAGLLGVNYTPNLVSTQVVNGTNYRYQANATVPGPTPYTWQAIVEIYAPINGDPHLVQIIKV